jgi:hypothetical protein
LPKAYKLPRITCTDAEGKAVTYKARTIDAPAGACARHLLWLSFENSPDGVRVCIEKGK